MSAIRENLKLAKQAQVREEVLKSAAKLFAARGYRAVTVGDIAQDLGFTKSAIYYYFPNKEEILWAITEESYDAYIQLAADVLKKDLPPQQALAAIIHSHAMQVMTRREWTAIFFKDQMEIYEKRQKLVRQRQREYAATIEKVYRAGVEAGVFKDLPTPVVVNSIYGLCNWLYVWYRATGRISPDAVANYQVEILMSGFSADPTAGRRDAQS